jgi:hypothetical protein
MLNSFEKHAAWILFILLQAAACGDAGPVETDSEETRPDAFAYGQRVDSLPEAGDTMEWDVTAPQTDVFDATGDHDAMDAGLEDSDDEDTVHEDGQGEGPTLYPPGRILSPLSPSVVEHLRAILWSGVELKDDVFMKVGASSTVSGSNLHCFGGPHVDLDEYGDLQPTVDFFLLGDAAGTSPFARETLAAKIGMSAGWSITGSPSPLEAEIEAIAPSYALVHYGTNDMGQGLTYKSAVWKFGDRLLELTDQLISQGIVPVLMSIAARGDIEAADRWVGSYNAVIRGIAQGRQVPFIDLHHALEPLAGHGLSGDGIHLNTFKEDGVYRPCVFTPEGLSFGMNMRNLISLMGLDALRWLLVWNEEVIDAPVTLQGKGDHVDPFIVPPLPFADRRDTADGGSSLLADYVGCNAEQNESGPEYVYRLGLDKETRIRAMVFDREETDIDLHLLDSTGTEAGCLARDHQILEVTLAPGIYHFVLDTFVGAGGAKSGEYIFVILQCDDDDNACDSVLLEDTP